MANCEDLISVHGGVCRNNAHNNTVVTAYFHIPTITHSLNQSIKPVAMTTRFSTPWTAFLVLVATTCSHAFLIPTTSRTRTATTTTSVTLVSSSIGSNRNGQIVVLSMGFLDGLSGMGDT